MEMVEMAETSSGRMSDHTHSRFTYEDEVDLFTCNNSTTSGIISLASASIALQSLEINTAGTYSEGFI